MLVDFRVKNFRSIRDEQTLSFVASADNSHRQTHCIETNHAGVARLMRSAVIYGANASGKSNLIFALATMRAMMLGSTQMNMLAEHYTPFRLDTGSSNEPTEFEVTLLLGGVRYQYGFAYDAERIRAEWLLVYRKAKAQRWFERHYDAESQSDEWQPYSTYFTGPKDTWRKATRPESLFITTSVQLNSELLRPISDWFAHELLILPARTEINLAPTLTRLDDIDFKSLVLKLMNAADIHVSDIRVEKRQGAQFELKFEQGKPIEQSMTNVEVPEIAFCHQTAGGEPVWFDRRFESYGTQRLLSYAGPLIDAMQKGGLLVVDEFDTSLHPLLTRYVLNLLHDPQRNPSGQVWMTTHDTSLLDPDILRRDQIWFVEKDKRQASQLYPLTDFSPRKHEALERGYLMGRYGALPFLSDFRFEGLRQ